MKKVFESELVGIWESAERIIVYELEGEEFQEFESMSHHERCDAIGVYEERGTGVMPGALYHSYGFDFPSIAFMVVTERIAYNV